MILTSLKTKLLNRVCAPIGAFGNHVRWLMLLDPSNNFIFSDTDERRYQNLAGPGWPSYEKYIKSDWSGVSVQIKDEIMSLLFSDNIHFDSLESKLNFIKFKVYSDLRTWWNWLIIEWKYRRPLDQIIKLNHSYVDPTDNDLKTLILRIDPVLAYRCYLKFNSNLNNTLPDSYVQKTQYANHVHSEIATNNPHVKLLSTDILYQPTLDRLFYTELIDWFGMSNLYNEANEIHHLWYCAHQRAEKEFVRDIAELYK